MPRMRCFYAIASFLCFVFQATQIAQAGEGEWRTYTVVDGLISPDVTGIFQDSRGDMWFITDKGVSRFDGENFRSFTEKDGLPSGRVKQILEDKNGHLWFITEQQFTPDGRKHGTVSRYDGKTFRQITEGDGPAGGFSNVMLKDKSGVLWFANAHGLTKYDGSRFQSFGVKELQDFIGWKYEDRGIYAIFESRNGDIWLGGGDKYLRGLPPFVIRYDGKAFRHFLLASFPSSATIYTIAEDEAGNLWFGGRYILCKYDGKNFERFDHEKPGTFVIKEKAPPLPNSYSPYIAPTPHMEGDKFNGRSWEMGGDVEAEFTIWPTPFFKDSHNRLWFNMPDYLFLWAGDELHHFMSLTWDTTQEPVPFDEKGLPYWFPGEPILEDSSGNLWFKSGNGAHRYDGRGFRTFTVADGLGSDNVSVIFEDRDGKFWFGHDNGVTIFDPAIQNFTTRGARPIYEDKEGFVWFSRLPGGGVARYDGEKLQYFSEKQIEDRKPDIISILDDRKGGLWFIGNSTNRIFHYRDEQFRRYNIYGGASTGINEREHKFISDLEGNLWLTLSTPESPIRWDGGRFQALTAHGWEAAQNATRVGTVSSPRITDLHADSKGNIWFATRDEGVKRYDGVSLKTFTKADGLGSNDIRKIFEDKDGNLWFVSGSAPLLGTPLPNVPPNSNYTSLFDGKVYVSRYDGVSIQNFTVDTRGDASMTEIVIHQDVHGILWLIGYFIGIWRYDGTNFKRVLRGDELVEEIFGWGRSSITDSAGNLWLATGKGALKYDGVQFHIYTAENGFLVNDIRDVHEDREGNLWFATWGGGVVRYNGETFQAITTRTGLMNNNVGRIFEDSRGSLWFVTNGGVTKYTPKWTERPPQVKLTKVIADKVDTDFDEELQLPATVRRVTFEYQGRSLKRAVLLYTHKLVGYDTDWSRPSPENRVEYNRLKPGRYVFGVKAIRENLKYANPPAMVVFTIAPPFWTQPRFYVPLGVGSVMLFLIARLIIQWKRATALRIALRQKEEAEVRRIRQELEDARKMQMSLLPKSTPDVDGFELAGASLPAGEVGGDFYDYLTFNDGLIGIALADVSGKGMKGAMHAVLSYGVLHIVAKEEVVPSQMLGVLNHDLNGRFQERTNCAMMIATIETKRRLLRYANAGIPYPIVKRCEDFFELESNGCPLGGFKKAQYEDCELELQSGDVVVFFSDGVTEAPSKAEPEQLYMETERLFSVIGGLDEDMTAQAMIDAIFADVFDFSGHRDQSDDITVVVVKVQ